MLNDVSIVESMIADAPMLIRPEAVPILDEILDDSVWNIFYLWGASGMGKSHTARALGEVLRRRSHRILHTSGHQLKDEEDLLRAMVHTLDMSIERPISVTLCLKMLETLRRDGPLLWVFDDLDARWSGQRWFTSMILETARRTIPILLIGAEAPARMWPGEAYFQGRLHTVRMNPLDATHSKSLLIQRNITDPDTIQLALGIAQGIPQTLVAIADGMSLAMEKCPRADVPLAEQNLELPTYIIEQLCHPGSRRLAWRAGQGESGSDTLLAAASLVPKFTLDLMISMVGPELVRKYWVAFTRLAWVQTYREGYYALSPVLRLHINNTVQKVRPWSWEQWANAAVHFYLQQLHSGRLDITQVWGLIGGLARNRLATTPFFSDASDDHWDFTWEERPASSNRRIHAVVRRDQQIFAEARGCIDGHGVLHLQELPQWSESSAATSRLVYGAAAYFHRFSEVHWTSPPDSTVAGLLDLLRFDLFLPDEHRLQVPGLAVEDWLQSVLLQPQAVVPTDPVQTVQTVLQAIRDGQEDLGHTVQTFWDGVGGTTSFRTWFLDALCSLNAERPLIEKPLLEMYYLDHRGTHEELAELLHVSSATYFRNQRAALEALAASVFP